MLVTQREWAQMQGFSKQHASKLIQQGHVILEDGLVDTEQADAALAAMRNPNKQIYRKHSSTGSTHQKTDDEWLRRKSGDKPSTAELSTVLLKTRIKNEVAKGKMLEIEAKAKTGQYVDARDVERQAFHVARTVRDSLQNIPDRVSSLLASISDANQIYDVLSKEIRLALESLAEGLQ